MVSWLFQYWNGSAWVNFQNAHVDHIMEELSSLNGGGNAAGQEECVFDLPNTAANRAIVQALPYAQCLYNGALIYPLANQGAVVGALRYSPTTIEVTLYNAVFMKLAQAGSTVTQAYTDTAVSAVAAHICGLASVPVGVMPDISVSVTFNNENCFAAMQDLATACGLDYWGDNNGFNIGTRDGTLQTLGWCDDNSKRGLDYSKQVDTVIVNGVSSAGVAIQGVAYSSGFSAGNTGSVASFTVKNASDITTLNNIAALKLQKLNNPSDGNSLECLISQVATWHPGQYVSCSRPDLDLVGSYIIQRITKQSVTCTVEVDAAMPQLDVDAIEQDANTSALANSTTQPSTQIPVNVSLQGLLDLYHLTEGTGTTAIDSTPNIPQCPGTMSGSSWITNPAFPGKYFLNLTSTGYVDCPNGGNAVGLGSCCAFAIGGWFSPSALVNLGNLIGKANCYILQLYGTAGAIRFGAYIGGTWYYVTSPNGVASVGGRCFAMGVYDGVNLYLYVSDPSGVNQLLINPSTGNPYFNVAQMGNLGASTSDTYIGGSNYQGVVSECMIWGRALQASEVQALFFQPLTNVVAQNYTLPAGAYLAVGTSIKASYVVSLTYLLDTLIQGNIVQSSAGGTMNSYESGYVCLALLQQGSSYYSQVQSILDLWASLQNSDGSWYQQYEPYSPYTDIANIKVDSGAALLAWAMSYYDQLTSGTRYKTIVQNALSFIRQLQYDCQTSSNPSNLIANLISNGTTDTTALLADCGECLLSAKAAMDAYGVGLTMALGGAAGYSVQTFANNLYYSICVTGWRGSTALYFDTSYPYGQNTAIPFNYQEKISYTQALCSRAVYVFSASAYLSVTNYSSAICQPCLNYITSLTKGVWGGIYYCPYSGASGQTQNNYTGYAAHMAIAAETVSSTMYASLITGLINFIKWCTLPGGQIYDFADSTGLLWESLLSDGSQGSFLALDIALALIAGA